MPKIAHLNSTISNIKKVFYSTATKQFGRFLHGYVSALLLGPSLYGLWNGARLILDYGAYLNMGTLYAMERQIPYLKGAKEDHNINAIEYNGFIWNAFGTTLGSIIIFSIGFFYVNDNMRLTIVMISFILFTLYMGTFYQYHLRANQLFNALAVNSFIDFFGSMIAIGLTFFMGYKGFLIGFLLRSIMIWVSAEHSSPFKFEWRKIKDFFDLTASKYLLKFGLPVMAVGLVTLAYQSLDRIVILKYLDTEQLGFYSLSTIVVLPLSLINRSVVGVLYPMMSEDFGASNDMKSLRRYTLKPSKAIMLVSTIFGGLFHVSAPFLVFFFLPQYKEGINATTILVYAMIFSFIYGIHVQFFTSIGRQRFYLIVVCVMFIIKLLFSVILLDAGFSINGVAFASLVTEYLTYFVIVVASMKLFDVSRKEVIQEICFTTGIVVYIFAVCEIIKRIFIVGSDLTISTAVRSMVAQQSLIVLCLTPVIFSFYSLLGKEKIIRLLGR